ncbi:MAG TPA: hypothetical protein VK285_00710 [Gaiellaceae bacterium]|nr:hypothetical protein [Gaiellaceae bacterium]
MSSLVGWIPVLAQVAASQKYLTEARQMQAVSLEVHIRLLCFGIFPRDAASPAYKVLAQRWLKVMLILFAIGVVRDDPLLRAWAALAEVHGAVGRGAVHSHIGRSGLAVAGEVGPPAARPFP